MHKISCKEASKYTFVPSVMPQSVDADKKRLDAMMEQVRAASALRSNSVVWVQSMRNLGKHIFDDPTKWVEIPGGEVAQVEIAVEPPGIANVSLESGVPVMFGILTTDSTPGSSGRLPT